MNKQELLEIINNAIKEDEIVEFDSIEEALKYFNTYDYQNLKSIEELKEFQDEYGFGMDGKWYHINYDETLELLKEHGYLEWKSKIRTEIYTVFSQDRYMTFIMEEVFENEEPISVECKGFYFGEPDEELTKAYYGELKANL